MPETQTHSPTPAIEMRGVTVATMRDASQIVAKEINWTVLDGEFWVVAGPQRSGKSDLLMLMGGLMSPVRGTYRCFGEEMPIFEDDRLPQRLRLGLVFDSGQLFNQMTLAENVALPLRYHENLSRATAEPRVQALMEMMELTAVAHHSPSTVARNWQKRAGLARALMLQPDVLLLDNPLSGLDARHAAWWLNFLEQLSAGHSLRDGRPMTIVATTEDLRPWLGNKRKFALIDEKTFSVIGTREQLATSNDPLVRELLSGDITALSSDTIVVKRES